jgi:hypothetical protein
MSKYALVFISLLLSACVTDGESRPAPYLKAETLLQRGLEAYQNDDFTQATEKFTAALLLYQSFDNAKGIAIAQLNLAETALAIHEFNRAHVVLDRLATASLESELQNKRQLLEVKLAWQQQHYALAFSKLQPLLAQINAQQPATDKSLNLWAIQAELELLMNPLAPSAGLARLQTALTVLPEPSPYYQAVLNRLLAKVAFNQQHNAIAIDLLTQALHYYQAHAKRRAIAQCLEELAAIYLAQQQRSLAKQNLTKALLIRRWLKDDYQSKVLTQQLQWLERR